MFTFRIAAWLAVLFILLVPMAIGTPTASAIPAHLNCSTQNRAGENAVLVAKCGIQSAGYLNQYGWSAYIGKSDAPSARRNRVASGLVLCTYVPGVSYTAYPAQYGQNIIPNIRPANRHFGRDPSVRFASNAVYDGSTRYDGTSGSSLAAESTGATFGNAVSNDYRATFFTKSPELGGQVVVHHAVPQRALTLYPSEVTEAQIYSLENLRGIPKEINSDVHLSQIRIEWNRFYEPFRLNRTSPTVEQLLQKATEIDAKFGSQVRPQAGGG